MENHDASKCKPSYSNLMHKQGGNPAKGLSKDPPPANTKHT